MKKTNIGLVAALLLIGVSLSSVASTPADRTYVRDGWMEEGIPVYRVLRAGLVLTASPYSKLSHDTVYCSLNKNQVIDFSKTKTLTDTIHSGIFIAQEDVNIDFFNYPDDEIVSSLMTVKKGDHIYELSYLSEGYCLVSNENGLLGEAECPRMDPEAFKQVREMVSIVWVQVKCAEGYDAWILEGQLDNPRHYAHERRF